MLIHLDSHEAYIEWYWSIIAAGSIPVVSTPLASDPVARERHLRHLVSVLDNPKVLTAEHLRSELSSVPTLDVTSIETVSLCTELDVFLKVSQLDLSHKRDGDQFNIDSIAVMMLTSGSTGHAKAVELCHSQLLASVEAKSDAIKSTPADVFLNWIGEAPYQLYYPSLS